MLAIFGIAQRGKTLESIMGCRKIFYGWICRLSSFLTPDARVDRAHFARRRCAPASCSGYMQTHLIMKYVSNCKSVSLLPLSLFFSKVNLVVNRLIRDIRFNTNTTQYWLDLLENSGIPYGPINNMAAVFSDPQVKKQQLFSSLWSF